MDPRKHRAKRSSLRRVLLEHRSGCKVEECGSGGTNGEYPDGGKSSSYEKWPLLSIAFMCLFEGLNEVLHLLGFFLPVGLQIRYYEGETHVEVCCVVHTAFSFKNHKWQTILLLGRFTSKSESHNSFDKWKIWQH